MSGTAGLTDNRFEDADGDGLTEAQEEDTYGTSDIVADFDADNYRDGAEVAAGTGPADPHSFPWDGDIPLPQTWVKVAGGNAKDMGFRGDRFVSVEQSSVGRIHVGHQQLRNQFGPLWFCRLWGRLVVGIGDERIASGGNQYRHSTTFLAKPNKSRD